MELSTLRELLRDADEKKYGVGLFNILNLEMLRGITAAAEAERSPLIIGVARYTCRSSRLTGRRT